MNHIKKKRAILALVCALSLPVPAAAENYGDMFSTMFRMMLVMMNVVSDAMLDNKNDNGWGSGDNFGSGMTAWPMMYGMSGMNPVTGFGGLPGTSPWSGFSSFPMLTGMSGMNPVTGFGGLPGVSPWSGSNSFPMNGMNPWANQYTNTYPSNILRPYVNHGYNGRNGGYPQQVVSLLGGRWYGNSGEILEIRGDRFRLQDGQSGIKGAIRIKNNIVHLFSPQTGTVSQYTFIRNQSELMLQDATGQVLSFRLKPAYAATHIF